ncbi:TrmH family RNA methyltransferase [Saccharopolyspora spinosa]|uniref:TrmH family RNA methyltransferase n=1 Tax=Saccharopolyspora spinosa TaxID=60894 RepID=A0A2N3Y2H0_SACSN|nr:TrmH family RNA methyltransferase [Saccharopolyspora spinosa]PKW17119.1 TrmH family RNA methyltransferase [Saccharopolyspora spinosa]
MSDARRDPGKIRGKGSAGARSGQSLRVSTRNALFQQWQALLSNRTKRQRSGEFLIHGVRPITLAVERDWPLRSLLYPSGRKLSSWARRLIDECAVKTVEVHPDLLWELGERESEPPELIAVAELRPDDLDRVPVEQDFLGVIFDRPTNPGNIGTLVRSADAFGAHGLIVSGHAADVYDPKSVRASTGSLFSVPAVRVPSPRGVLDWVTEHRRRGVPIAVVGTDENGTSEITECDLTRPVLLVIGNETTGMSTTWQEMCDEVVRVPIGGAASSLNAASAGTVLLYEAARQRGFPVA